MGKARTFTQVYRHFWQNDDFVALRGAAVLITVQRVADHRVPQWPRQGYPEAAAP